MSELCQEELRRVAIGRILKITRILYNYKMTDLAKILDSKEFLICLLENGERNLTEEKKTLFCSHFGISTLEFENLVDTISKSIASQERNLLEEAYIVCSLFREKEKEKKREKVSSQTIYFAEIRPIKRCRNNASYGEICVRCNRCGRFS